MTNAILSHPSSELTPELRALAAASTGRRPVKVVEHPTFRAARARLGAGFTVVQLPVAALNRGSTASPDACAAGAPILDRSQEAA
jgi:hypothetical protein